MAKKLVIFDFDGTIADTLKLGVQIANSLTKDTTGQIIQEDEIEKYRGFTAQELIQHLEISKIKIPIIAYKFQKLLFSRVREMKAIKGMVEVLRLIQQKYEVGIVTSNSKENVEAFLKNNKLDEVFRFVHCERNLFGKSHIFKKLLKQLKYTPDQAVYVGDETRDIEAAKKIHMDIISVTWGFNNKALLEKLNPTKLIDKPEQLPLLLETM